MNYKIRWTSMLVALGVGLAFLAFALGISAQVQTQTTTTSGTPTVETTVERGEVVYVQGNDLIIKMEDGSLRDFANVPESARALVDGKEIGIHDVKVGMKLEKWVTRTTTPKTITTVDTVKGKVWHIMPPTSVILTLENGTNQRFNIPKDQKFKVNGEMKDAWGLKKGMNVTATRIVEVPETHVTHERLLTGTMPPPPPPDQPILVAVYVPPATPAALGEELPKTASLLPLIGLLGLLSTAAALGLRVARSIS